VEVTQFECLNFVRRVEVRVEVRVEAEAVKVEAEAMEVKMKMTKSVEEQKMIGNLKNIIINQK
jgi:hypothetical protein